MSVPILIREKKTIEAMVKIYCNAHHKARVGLCADCRGLLDYAMARLDKCPFGAKKPACSKCTIHCYGPSMRSRVTEVMKYAGPRMISKHPVLALMHAIK
jgi:Nitrous oxide-stimulated promoter